MEAVLFREFGPWHAVPDEGDKTACGLDARRAIRMWQDWAEDRFRCLRCAKAVPLVCRTCQRPITYETRTEPGYLPREGWYDDLPSQPLICFSAINYRHEPQEAS